MNKDPDWNDIHREQGTEGAQKIFDEAMKEAQARARVEVCREDFVACMPQPKYIFKPTGDLWPAASVNPRLDPMPQLDVAGNQVLDDNGKPKFMPVSRWLDINAPVEQMTWAPGEPTLIEDRLILEGGWIVRRGCRTFNLYRPPIIVPGNTAEAKRWLDHVYFVYPDDAEDIIMWFAHRVQRPGEKINHALVLGGDPGIGKDTIFEPVKRACGHWNVPEIIPKDLFGTWTDFYRAVILRINEARDLGEYDRFGFYDHMKGVIAAPPDVLRVNEKHKHQYYVPNVCGVVITTNHKIDGIYLPANDRRHRVAWSERKQEDFDPEYFPKLWRWYNNGGDRHVAAYLRQLDISGFDPKAPPPKTPAFWAIVDANRAPEEAELADALDLLGNPLATTLILVQAVVNTEFQFWLGDRKNRRIIPHRFEKCGYVPVRNEAADDGLWRMNGKRQAVYARAELSLHDQLAAVRSLSGVKESELWGEDAQASNDGAPAGKRANTGLQVLGPEPDHACVQCGVNDGKVYLIRDNFGKDNHAKPLHEQCAPFFFKLR
jgi:hypothetical protein